MSNYLVVLFKNKKRKRIINKFLTYEKAISFFNNYKQNSDDIIFEKEVVSGQPSQYELGLIQVGKPIQNRIYLRDSFGRNIQVKMDEDGFDIINITPIKKEELIYDANKKRKISVPKFIKDYLKGTGVKLVSGLNNKVVVQDDEVFNIFVLKDQKECERFLDCLTNHFFKIKRADCLIVKDSSMAQRKYLYDLLVSKGFDKRFLYRKFTSRPQSK
jgi:hypothetical protein